jgi:hypothetical protein
MRSWRRELDLDLRERFVDPQSSLDQAVVQHDQEDDDERDDRDRDEMTGSMQRLRVGLAPRRPHGLESTSVRGRPVDRSTRRLG